MSFNGGKDSVVTLVLAVLALVRLKKQGLYKGTLSEDTFPLKAVYFEETNPFKEVDETISLYKNSLKMEMHVKPRDFKKSIADLKEKSGMKQIILGSRSGDPYCGTFDAIISSEAGTAFNFRHPAGLAEVHARAADHLLGL